MVGLLEPRFGVEGKIARRAREESEGVSGRGGEEMVGVQGEEVGEVRVEEVQGGSTTGRAAT